MRKLLIVALLVVCIGCFPGLGDYEYELVNGYKLSRSSAHQIVIRLEGFCTNIREDTNFVDCEDITIPAKVIELAWDDRYIIAKQFGFTSDEDLDMSQDFYWILDTINRERYGPFNKTEFEKKLIEFGLDELKLKPVDAYRK